MNKQANQDLNKQANQDLNKQANQDLKNLTKWLNANKTCQNISKQNLFYSNQQENIQMSY